MCLPEQTPAVWLCFTVVILLIADTHAFRPLVNGLPTRVVVGELEDKERIIHYLNVTEPTNDAYTCYINSITGSPAAANGDEFIAKEDASAGSFEIWTTAAGWAAFNAGAITQFILEILCENGNGEVSNGNDYITVDVQAGEKLIWGSMPTAVLINATATVTSDTIFTESVSATLSGHTSGLRCGLHSVTISGYFSVDPGTCAVKATADLIGIDSSTSTVYLVMSLEDTIDKIVEYETLTINLFDQNTIPISPNMASTVTQSVPESTAVGTSLFNVQVSDPDTEQTHTFSMDCTPATGYTMLDIDSAGDITVVGQLNHEVASSLSCTVEIFDGNHTSVPYRYVLTVTDVNEVPTLNEPIYYATFEEGLAFSSYVDPNIVCSDEDTLNNKTLSFRTSTYSPYFFIESDNRITFSQEFDVDTSGNDQTFALEILCYDGNTIDGSSLTATSTLSVTVIDINDNAPVFSPPSSTIYVDQFVAAGSTIGTYSPTDVDSGTNGLFTCAGVSSTSYGDAYTVNADCSITRGSTTIPNGSTVKYDVTATDLGSPAQSGVGKLDIIYRETATTTVSTTTTTEADSYKFFGQPENIAMFVLLLLAGLALLGLLSYCLARLCCGASMGNMCDCNMRNRNRTRRYPKRRAVTPEDDRTPPRSRRSYSPKPQKVTVVQERPPAPVQTIYKQAPPYYPTVIPAGRFPSSPFIPYR